MGYPRQGQCLPAEPDCRRERGIWVSRGDSLSPQQVNMAVYSIYPNLPLSQSVTLGKCLVSLPGLSSFLSNLERTYSEAQRS